MQGSTLLKRAYHSAGTASSWEELWEAGSYYERVSELLEDAKHYAIFVGWQVDSRLPFHRPSWAPGEGFETLKEKVIRICDSKPDFHIYFLMWDHAYFYVLERETLQGRIWDDVHPRVHFIFDNRHPLGGSHHEKLVIIDGKIALCGGIDLCDERWDSPQHLYFDPRRSLTRRKESHGPYHDLAVQVTGPICHEIQTHVAERWRAISSTPFPDPSEATLKIHGGHRVYLSRTRAQVDAGERGQSIVREIEFLVRELIGKAQKRIILEGQYYWSEAVNEILIAKIHEMKGKDFEIILVLAELSRRKSLTRQMAYQELKLLQKLEDAARYSRIKLITGCPYAFPSPESNDWKNAKPVYVHSKVIVIDDRFLSIGSANLAARAFRLDSELNLTLEATGIAERHHIAQVAERILAHWNIHKSKEDPHVRLRLFNPRLEIRQLKERSPILARLPWQIFFDPKVPWAYLAKRKIHEWERRRSTFALLGIFTLWLSGVVIAFKLARIPLEASPWAYAYSILLTSNWLLPLPFTLISLVTAIHLEPILALRLVICSLWISSIWGYFFSRFFPTWAGRFFRKTSSSRLPARIGFRSFPYLVSVLLDPRVSLRSKIAYQGLYCVPFPWFLLGTLMVLPSALYLLCLSVGRMFYPHLNSTANQWAPPFLILITLLSLGTMLKELERKSHGKTSDPRSVLQHS